MAFKIGTGKRKTAIGHAISNNDNMFVWDRINNSLNGIKPNCSRTSLKIMFFNSRKNNNVKVTFVGQSESGIIHIRDKRKLIDKQKFHRKKR